MTTESLQWNRPNETWRLASYEPATERRVAKDERRGDRTRTAIGERRRPNKRSLRSLFKL